MLERSEGRGERLEALKARLRLLERGGLERGGLERGGLERGGLERGGVGAPRRVLPLGLAELDERLPGGGLPLSGLHEILPGRRVWDEGAATGFLLAWVGRLLSALPGPLLWVSPADDLYTPAVAAAGLSPERLLRVTARDDTDRLWVLEEALRCPELVAVVGELAEVERTALRRLQLAAETAGRPCLLLQRRRSAPCGAEPPHPARPSPALTRWRVSAAPSDPRLPRGLLGRPRWSVELLRCRGGQPASLLLEWDDATGALAVASGLRDRAAPAALKA